MTQKERVAILKEHFSGYDAPLDSKVMRPQQYGITHTAKARQLLQGCKKEKSPVYKLTIRLDRGQEDKLRKALKGKEPTEWLREIIQRKIERASRLREQTERLAMDTDKSIAEACEAVN